LRVGYFDGLVPGVRLVVDPLELVRDLLDGLFLVVVLRLSRVILEQLAGGEIINAILLDQKSLHHWSPPSSERGDDAAPVGPRQAETDGDCARALPVTGWRR
jgi:hypothetical protein